MRRRKTPSTQREKTETKEILIGLTRTERKVNRTFSENTTDDYIHIYGIRVVKMYKYFKAPIYNVGSVK